MKKTTTISSELEEHRERNVIITEELFYKMTQQSYRIAVLERALELCVNVLQREIDGDSIKATEVQAIYEIGKDYFINQAEKEMEEEK